MCVFVCILYPMLWFQWSLSRIQNSAGALLLFFFVFTNLRVLTRFSFFRFPFIKTICNSQRVLYGWVEKNFNGRNGDGGLNIASLNRIIAPEQSLDIRSDRFSFYLCTKYSLYSLDFFILCTVYRQTFSSHRLAAALTTHFKRTIMPIVRLAIACRCEERERT